MKGTKRKDIRKGGCEPVLLSEHTVIDFFCGAGGFSEGFRQQGFKVVMGIDIWRPAIDTHNLNHGLNDDTNDILDYWGEDSADVKKIEELPDTDFIIGSPSCTTFSMSNRAGKADKTSGIQLIEAYLRIVAVKKHQSKSHLRGWYMENVPKSKDHIREEYTFTNLHLADWAKSLGKNPVEIALRIKGEVLNAGDYGAPQERKRFIVGEWVSTGEFISPIKTHKVHRKSADLRSKMPKTNSTQKNKVWTDPNYPNLTLPAIKITDHFYDTGLYEVEWETAQHLKTNHPFMGKMAFPENENRTCRTITATKSAKTREAFIYDSERKRKGNGEYRTPTIREIASLMGFPYTYQFVGSEATKWKQIGNSVCPHMSSALAKALRRKMGLSEVPLQKIEFMEVKQTDAYINLNTFVEKHFGSPGRRNPNARFRRHPFKLGNMTVDLMNYRLQKVGTVTQNWSVVAFFGIGKDHASKVLSLSETSSIYTLLKLHLNDIVKFEKEIESNICTTDDLQVIYEKDLFLKDRYNPVNIVKRLGELIRSYEDHTKECPVKGFAKQNIPLAQLMAMYGLLRLLKHNQTKKYTDQLDHSNSDLSIYRRQERILESVL